MRYLLLSPLRHCCKFNLLGKTDYNLIATPKKGELKPRLVAYGTSIKVIHDTCKFIWKQEKMPSLRIIFS